MFIIIIRGKTIFKDENKLGKKKTKIVEENIKNGLFHTFFRNGNTSCFWLDNYKN